MLQKVKHILVEVLHFNEVDVEVVHFWCTVKPLNSGHIGGRTLVRCREGVPISEVD